jgi:hypothetical protein
MVQTAPDAAEQRISLALTRVDHRADAPMFS